MEPQSDTEALAQRVVTGRFYDINMQDLARGYLALAAEHRALQERAKALEEALRRFSYKVDDVSSALSGILVHASVHGLRYTGPQFVENQDEARALLSAKEST